MNYQEYILYETKVWNEVVIPDLLSVLSGPFIALDIGCAPAISLLALHNHKSLITAYGIEPKWKDIQEKKLLPLGIYESYYTNKGISILPLDGLDKSVPYSQATLIIKTFNPFVTWAEILNKTKPQVLITDIGCPVNHSDYVLIKQSQGPYSNTYLIYLKKT